MIIAGKIVSPESVTHAQIRVEGDTIAEMGPHLGAPTSNSATTA